MFWKSITPEAQTDMVVTLFTILGVCFGSYFVTMSFFTAFGVYFGLIPVMVAGMMVARICFARRVPAFTTVTAFVIGVLAAKIVRTYQKRYGVKLV